MDDLGPLARKEWKGARGLGLGVIAEEFRKYDSKVVELVETEWIQQQGGHGRRGLVDYSMWFEAIKSGLMNNLN